jgi:hypothetical protein
MPSAGLVWNDGATTPVAVTYTPEIVSASKTILVDRRLASADFQPKMERAYLTPSGTRKTTKVVDAFDYPIIRNVSGVDMVVGHNRVDCTMVRDPLSTDQEAKHALAFAANGVLNLENRKAYETKSPYWG